MGITATTISLNVNQLTAITITPLNQTIAIAATEQYDAMGTFLNPGGTTTDFQTLRLRSAWTSGSTAVAQLSALRQQVLLPALLPVLTAITA